MSSAEPSVRTIATFSHRGRLILDANTAHRGFKPTDGSSKIQAPNPREAPISKLQQFNCGVSKLVFEDWSFFGAWGLGFGALKLSGRCALASASSLAKPHQCGRQTRANEASHGRDKGAARAPVW